MKQKQLNSTTKKQKTTKNLHEKNPDKSPEKSQGSNNPVNKLTQSIDNTKKKKQDRQNSTEPKRLDTNTKKHERAIFSQSPANKNRKTTTNNKKSTIDQQTLKNSQSSNIIKYNTKLRKLNTKKEK